MKRYRIFFAVTVLVLASLSCKALSQLLDESPTLPPVEENSNPPVNEATEAPVDPNNDGEADVAVSGDFPVTSDAYNFTDMGDGGLLYYTKMPLEDVMKFYRDEYTAKGYTEREILTVVASGTFSMVFDGDPGGKAIVIQSVDLGDGSRTVVIRLEDI